MSGSFRFILFGWKFRVVCYNNCPTVEDNPVVLPHLRDSVGMDSKGAGSGTNVVKRLSYRFFGFGQCFSFPFWKSLSILFKLDKSSVGAESEGCDF